MRRCYLVCYDICDDKRLRRIFKTMKGYGEHWQYSVFFCVLESIDKVRLRGEIEEIINFKEDQIIILDLGPSEEGARESAMVLGVPLLFSTEKMIVI